MKRILIIGVGAQGSTIAKRLNEESNVKEIICADYDLKAAISVGDSLSKGRAVQINARDAVNHRTGLAAGKKITVQSRSIRLDKDFVLDHPGSNRGHHVLISVRDNGIGMAKQLKAWEIPGQAATEA